ncbi:hypothetical protein BU16DRAFT_525643 [Lophium mytilinum]|uniref:Uncharacterized protein n=1 Tax=Lophium mytilinum TaxID=390894 RepID=A0A6A6R057_9PEZI|nr:hypothetical protein BU16DRAFT_525643 [Lophium mytilinum]
MESFHMILSQFPIVRVHRSEQLETCIDKPIQCPVWVRQNHVLREYLMVGEGLDMVSGNIALDLELEVGLGVRLLFTAPLFAIVMSSLSLLVRLVEVST